MKTSNISHKRKHRTLIIAAAAFMLLMLVQSATAEAAGWNGIEPLKSKRADVERVLGKPIEDKTGENGTLTFKVEGGTVTILFVDAKFVATKKLSPDLQGTVLQIVLQHDNAKDTPESLSLTSKPDFEREDKQGVIVFRNNKDGIFYTFIGGQLKTTRYSPPAEQLVKLQRR